MSSKPILTLKTPLPPPPAPAGLSANVLTLLAKYPPPWVLGPLSKDGTYLVWVAADLEQINPETEAKMAGGEGPDGTFWRATAAKPRIVFDPGDTPKGVVAGLVEIVNVFSKSRK